MTIVIFSMLLISGCGDVYLNGDVDYYYEVAEHMSSVGVTRYCVYSKEFVKKFDNSSFEFHYYVPSPQMLFPLSEYEICIVAINYHPESYNLAKQDLFDNTEYLSLEPSYIYNEYEFYRFASLTEGDMNHILDTYLYMNVFNDKNNTIVLIGFGKDPTSDINFDMLEEEWPEFLRTYFGEYYDFDA